jgi:hypothetical protein
MQRVLDIKVGVQKYASKANQEFVHIDFAEAQVVL